MENSETEKIYPPLPSAPPLPNFPPNSNAYRIQEINKYKQKIKDDIDKYENILKSKKRSFNVLHYVNTASNGIGGILAAGSVTVLALGITGIGLPIVGVGLGAAGTSFITGSVLKKLVTKIKKYEKLLQNANSSYITINGILSDALIDENINPTEFKIIQKEYQNYSKNYANIKAKHQVKIQDVETQTQLESMMKETQRLKQR